MASNFSKMIDESIMTTLEQSTLKLWKWMKAHNFASYDHYDLLGTPYGIAVKALMQTNGVIGALAVSPIMLLDMFFPSVRRYFVKPKRSAEAIPYIIVGCNLLAQHKNDKEYFRVSQELLNWLEKQKVPTPHGSGWGLQFNWQSEAFVPRNTPCVTITALAATAFYETYLLTQDERHLSILQDAANFVIQDLYKTMRYEAQVFSYSLCDQRLVVNANSFAALILFYVLQFYPNAEMQILLDGLIEYILKEQNEDGSWFYHDKQQVPVERNFIDSFHSCFILENLFTIWQKTRDAQILQAIQKGYEYIVHNNLDNRHIVKLYNKYPYMHGIVVDIRSCAETITCFARLSEVFAEALTHAYEIAMKTIIAMQNTNGSFAFRRYWWGINRMPYMRWGQAPMFMALCVLRGYGQKPKEQGMVQAEDKG